MALRLRGVCKHFGALQALDGVDLDVDRGRITALLGENGAGKSTLMSILAGLVVPDGGHIELDGRPVRIDRPAQAIALGIGMVHQHFQLVPGLTVAENVLLGLAQPRWFLGRRAGHDVLRDLAARTGLAVNPAAPLWSLSVGEKQQVEILKVLWRGAWVLILDEPTAVLTPLEVQPFLTSLRQLADAGAAVVLITHKLPEVLAIADQITVLRRGRVVATGLDGQRVTAAELEGHILGHSRVTTEARPKALSTTENSVARLQVEALSARGSRGECALHEVSLHVHAGEIVGVAGVSGNGQRELADVLLGVQVPLSGRVMLDGQDLAGANVAQRRQRGLGLVPEDRLRQGAAPSLSVLQNLSLCAAQRPPHGLLLRWDALRRRAKDLVTTQDIRLHSIDQPAGELSGGNLQKLILARELDAKPRVLVVAQPTRGLDLGAASEVRRRLIALAKSDGAILLISEDVDELLRMAHRIVVLYRGRVAGILEAADATADSVGRLMLGHEVAA
ncbi:MAG: ABC transporter ATP-binding protein [Pseudomonadota bacterium]